MLCGFAGHRAAGNEGGHAMINTSEKPEKPIRVMVVDDHALFREGLVRLLASESGLEVCAACAGVAEALAALADKAPDVVLLDYDLGLDTGLRFIRRAAEAGHRARILVVTAGVEDADALSLLRSGVYGIFMKHNSPSMLVAAIRQVARGEVWLDQHFLRLLVQEASTGSSDPEVPRLSERERDVLRGVFEGLSNKEIGVRLRVSESSVKATIQQLFIKTGVRTRGQLVRVALERYRDYL
jgi:DNA-binding NarL/FixJ family response regulator